MKVLIASENTRAPAVMQGAVATIGTFDGVHCGHQVLIDSAVNLARERGRRSVVITFEPHPRSVLPDSRSPELLTTYHEKLAMIASRGVDCTLVVPFDRARSLQDPDDFVEKTVHGLLRPEHVFVGYDFHFGRDRSGDAALLTRRGAALGFGVSTVGQVAIDGQAVKSTAIREWLRTGHVQEASRALGRFYSLSGLVVAGAGRGRTLAARTANLGHLPVEKLLPGKGVYALFVQCAGGVHQGVANLGNRPTFVDDGATLLETHLLDWEGDLTGSRMTVHFVRYLRPERKFDTPDELAAQIREDARAAADYLDISDQTFIFTAESQFDSLRTDG